MYRILVIGVLIFLVNCRTFFVPDYSLSKDNILDGKKLIINKPKTRIKLENFSEIPPNPLYCNLSGKIESYNTFAQYIEDGLRDELEIANVYSKNGNITVTGKIIHIDIISNNWEQFYYDWNINIDIYLNAEKKYSVNQRLTDPSGGCVSLANSFVRAVQLLNSKIINHPELQKFIDETK